MKEKDSQSKPTVKIDSQSFRGGEGTGDRLAALQAPMFCYMSIAGDPFAGSAEQRYPMHKCWDPYFIWLIGD